MDSVIDVLLGGQYPSFISVLHSSHGFQGDFLDSIYERTVEGKSRGNVSGGLLIERAHTGDGALKGIQRIIKPA